LDNHPGWVVQYHHPDILNYVSPTEFNEEAEPNSVTIGMIGRSARAQDADSLTIVHIEDKRTRT
ncbi:MAG: hypothetical protein ACFFBD_29355, partial [Candidatus Hodarchaeota archaeon]